MISGQRFLRALGAAKLTAGIVLVSEHGATPISTVFACPRHSPRKWAGPANGSGLGSLCDHIEGEQTEPFELQKLLDLISEYFLDVFAKS